MDNINDSAQENEENIDPAVLERNRNDARCVLYRTRASLNTRTLYRYLHTPDRELVSIGIAGNFVQRNAVYVFRIFPDTTSHYWRFDGYCWKNLRTRLKPKKEKWCRVSMSRLRSKGKFVDFFRYEYYIAGCEIKPPNAWTCPYVVVHYTGDYNLKEYFSVPHGNVKATPLKAGQAVVNELIGMSTPTKDGCNHVLADIPLQQVARKRTGGIRRRRIRPKENNSGAVAPVSSGDLKSVNKSPHHGEPQKKADRNSSLQAVKSDAERIATPEMQNVTFVDGQNDRHGTPSLTGLQKDSPSEIDCPDTVPIHKARGFCRRNPVVKQNLLKKMNENKAPLQAYREVVTEGLMSNATPQLTPRNRSQAYNAKKDIAKSEMHDDLFEVLLFSKEHENVVLKFDLVPEAVLVLAHPKISEHFASLQRTKRTVTLHYDTTFEIGLFFTSILSFRHPLFEKEPMVPLAVMFHQSTREICHNSFFQTMQGNVLPEDFSGVIVTDRERSIRNAISTAFPKAMNIFCWNHIRRNVGEWATNHFSKDVSSSFRHQILRLLQADSEQTYANLLATIQTKWPAEFLSYYNRHIEADLKISYRPVLEGIGVYNQISGMTNNPAESANAAFKHVSQLKRASFFQALSTWYFYQAHCLMEIYRGFQNEGDFRLQNEVRSIEQIKLEDIHDALDSQLISGLVQDGKFPSTLFTNQPANSESLFEKTTLLGIARLIVSRKQIQWIMEKAVFVVTGLQNKNYLVDLALNKCTCIRARQCEHLMAVRISTGATMTAKPKRYPSLGLIYRKTARKNAGKKKGQGNRRLLKLPAKLVTGTSSDTNRVEMQDESLNPRKEHVTDYDSPTAPNSIASNQCGTVEDDNDENSTQSLASFKKLKTAKTPNPLGHCQKSKLDMMPCGYFFKKLKSANANDQFLTLPTGSISYAEMRTLELTHQLAELRVLSKTFNLKESERSTANWLVDSVIDGFLMSITDLRNDGSISLTSQEVLSLLDGIDVGMMFSTEKGGSDYHDWKTIQQIFAPYNLSGNHWILLVIRPQQKTILVMDPASGFQIPLEMKVVLQTLFNQKYGYNPDEAWKVNYPEMPLAFGENSTQCGPFVCMYAEVILQHCNLAEAPDIRQFRQHIAATLIGKCHPMSDQSQKCYQCKRKVTATEKCSFCSRRAHLSCLSEVRVRGRSYHVCN